MLEIGPADANVIECPFSMVKAPSSIPIKKRGGREREEKGRDERGIGEEKRGLCSFCPSEVFPVLLLKV